MCVGLVVKNTFICVVEDEEVAPQTKRRRAFTECLDAPDKADLLCSSPLLLSPLAVCSGESSLRGVASPSSMLAALRAGGAGSAAALGELCASVRTLSFDEQGCGVVLEALDLLSPADAQALLAGLRGAVAEAACSPYASLVLLRAMELLGGEAASFVAAEMRGQAHAAASTAHGSEVLCQLQESAVEQPATKALVEALIDECIGGEGAALCCQKHGHLVALAVMQCGAARHKGVLASALFGDLQRYARHRFASKVLREALLSAPANERATLARELMSVPGAVTALACHCFGVMLVRALLEQPRFAKQVRQSLSRGRAKLQKDRYGSELLLELGLDKVAGRWPPCPATATATIWAA